MKKKIADYNFAYKCLYFDEGLILVFNNITPFKENEIQAEVINGELFVFFGNNVALLSSKAIKHLKKTKMLYLTKCGLEDYEDNSYQYAFEVDPILLSQLEGMMLVLEKMKETIFTELQKLQELPELQELQENQKNVQENQEVQKNQENQENTQKIKQVFLVN
jgi:hypothetical protein